MRWRDALPISHMWRRLITDNAALGIQFAANALVPLLLVPHFVRVLGIADYGALAMLVAAAGFATVVVQYAFHLTGPADYAALRGGHGTRQLFLDVLVARLMLLIGVATSLLLLLALTVALDGPAAHLWREALWLLGLPVAAALNAGWFLQARGRFAVLAVLSVVAVAAALAIGWWGFGAHRPSRPWAAAALAAGPVVLALGTLAWSWRELPDEGATARVGRATRLLRVGAPAFMSQFIAALYTLAGPLAVGAVSGVRAAGAFSAIERPASAVLAALTLSHTAAYPRATTLYTMGNLEGYRALLTQVVSLYAVGLAAVGLLLWLGEWHVLRFLFGDTPPAEGRLLLWLAYLWIASSVAGPILTGYFTVRGTPRDILRLTVSVLLVSLPAGVLGAHLWGAAGWLAAAIAGQMLVLMHAVRAWRRLSLPNPK